MATVTVIERFKRKGIETDKEVTWAVGARVSHRWVETYGQQPEKDLRQKTSGLGSHCLAIYPETWTPVIDETIDAVIAEGKAREQLQPQLPF